MNVSAVNNLSCPSGCGENRCSGIFCINSLGFLEGPVIYLCQRLICKIRQARTIIWTYAIKCFDRVNSSWFKRFYFTWPLYRMLIIYTIFNKSLYMYNSRTRSTTVFPFPDKSVLPNTSTCGPTVKSRTIKLWCKSIYEAEFNYRLGL